MKDCSSGRERRLTQRRDKRSASHILPFWQYRRSTADMNELGDITKKDFKEKRKEE